MSDCFDFFEKIYCINLKHRIDRWESCISQFSSLGISERVSIREGIICNHPKLSKKQNAQIGCALSHYYILKEAQKNNYSNVLVLEDDFLFLDKGEFLKSNLEKSTAELPKNWDLFYLGGFFVKGYSYDPVEKYSKNLLKVNTCFCTHAISYSNSGANKILKNLRLDLESEVLAFSEEYEAIDWYLVRDFQKDNNCFAPENLLCIQKEGYSDIEKQYFNYKEKFQNSYNQYIKK